VVASPTEADKPLHGELRDRSARHGIPCRGSTAVLRSCSAGLLTRRRASERGPPIALGSHEGSSPLCDGGGADATRRPGVCLLADTAVALARSCAQRSARRGALLPAFRHGPPCGRQVRAAAANGERAGGAGRGLRGGGRSRAEAIWPRPLRGGPRGHQAHQGEDQENSRKRHEPQQCVPPCMPSPVPCPGVHAVFFSL